MYTGDETSSVMSSSSSRRCNPQVLANSTPYSTSPALGQTGKVSGSQNLQTTLILQQR